VDHVLGTFSAEEKETLDERLERTVALMRSFAFIGLQRTMNTFNNT
jgi:PTH1 family peptidyl-tRNA hydrolase